MLENTEVGTYWEMTDAIVKKTESINATYHLYHHSILIDLLREFSR